jgi:hypothetical protein
MAQAIFLGNPILDGNQVIYVSDIGGDFYTHDASEGALNKTSALHPLMNTMYCSGRKTFTIEVVDNSDSYGVIEYKWSGDGGTTYNGATKLHTPCILDAPFVGSLGATTYDQPGLLHLPAGDMLAFAQKWTTAEGKQIVCKKFDYGDWSWGSETVVHSSTDDQSYPTAYLYDSNHIAIAFLDDTDTSTRKIRICISADEDCDSFAQFAAHSYNTPIYNLNCCKIGDQVIVAYDDGTDTKCRVSFNNGYHFYAESNQITIQTSATDPAVINNGNNMFACFFIYGGTPSVYGKVSQFGDSWAAFDSPNPIAVGDGVDDTMSYPAGMLDDNNDMIVMGRSDQGKTMMSYSNDFGETWSDISSVTDEILPDCDGLAVSDSGGMAMFLLRGRGTVKSIGALAGRVWTKDVFLSTPLDQDFYGINGDPTSNGWSRTGNDNGSQNGESWEIDTNTPGGTEQTYYYRPFSPTITDGFVDIFRMKITAGGGNNQSCIRRYDINNGISFCLAFGTPSVVVKDLQGSTDLVTDTHDYTAYHDFMVAVKKTGSNVNYMIKRKEASDPWNGTWTEIASGATDGYLAEGGARTTQTGFGDNSAVNGENSISYWVIDTNQDSSDDTLSASTPTLTGRRMGPTSSMHVLSNSFMFSMMGGGAAIGNTYEFMMNSNVPYSNLFSTMLDAPLISSRDGASGVDWEIILDSNNYNLNVLYNLDALGFKGANFRKMKVYGTNTSYLDSNPGSPTVEVEGINFHKVFDSEDYPDDTSFVQIAELDSFTGDTGTITALDESWATISGKSWQINEHIGKIAEFDDGAFTVCYKITQNTADTLIFDNGIELQSHSTVPIDVGDTVNICSGEALQEVSAASYRWIKLQVEVTFTEAAYYLLPFFTHGFEYKPDTEFFNTSTDDKSTRTWNPNVDTYVGRTGVRRTHKLGGTRQETTLQFLAHNDSDILLRFRKWLEYLGFELTPVLYVEDDTVKQGSNYYELRLGRIMGGLKRIHEIEDMYTHEAITFSEEV